MSNKILYLGDTAIDQQASYLTGIMSHHGFDYDYIDSSTKFVDSFLAADYKLIIISDYPASNFTTDQMEVIVAKTITGMSLLMIGGWESFTGLGGDYCNTPLASVLPVIMKESDDRTNFSSPCLVIANQSHQIIDSLPFDENIPAIGGLNSFEPKADAEVLLSAVQFNAAMENGKVVFAEACRHPLLVVNQTPQSRSAAFASDVAPHWVGPLVDWGDKRVKAQAQGAEAIEVGSDYAKFFANLLNWLLAK